MDLYTSVDCYDNMARSKYATKEEEEAARAECDRMKEVEEQTIKYPTGELSPQTAGFMGLPKIAWIAIIGIGVYYAYSKGMLKKIIK